MQSRKTAIGLTVAAVAAAVVLLIVLSGGSDSGTSESTGTTKIAFKNGAPVGGVGDIEVKQGDPVRIDVTSDVPAEVHIHGYELQKDVKPGQTAKFDFPATAEGEFEIEVHHLAHGHEEEGVQIAALKVAP